MRLLLSIILYLVGVIQAAPTTNTTTTTSDGSEASSFTNRSLWSIISSCALTLFACIYSAIHPNIPSPEDSLVLILRRRLGIMLMALIAPELIVTWAMRQWLSAHYAWTRTHSFFLLMGGFMLYVDGKPYHTLLPDQLLLLIRDKRIDAPTLTAKQICDKSKGNVISKGLIIIQVAWFILQLISRTIYHLDTTKLETGTLAFAVLNFLTYAVWWNKPLDVQCPHPVYWKSSKSKPEDYIKELGSPFQSFTHLSNWWAAGAFPHLESSDIDLEESHGDIVLVLAGLLIATIFGGIHCIAWFLWHISAVAITCTPWLWFLLVIICGVLKLDNLKDTPVFILCTILYIPARAILLVLMVTTLRNLPPDAYEVVSWTSLIPHL
ncbi:uncharacterized protein EDB91DRAFT_1330497 [Suillus paluster]|uniref:uncharacterized protein n=1 Tax=Suillus paluster TaxID=48578 RepID=UPI001B86AF36|nr:uncharacterized protein EDB91DRAFT_1330497 [Suillus paluster]KAG1730551.1 hypothetical protein EDB91DRAFT_1330497 [Suillus paluster]